MLGKFKVSLFTCKTLKLINDDEVFAVNTDQARKAGEEIFRVGPNQFIGTEKISNKLFNQNKK